MSTFIIAEAGVNHNGDLEKAIELVDVAVAAQADAVKFQTFKAENLASESAGKANYQKKLTDSKENQIEMLKRLELPHEHHFKLKEYCEQNNIEFMSTAFDLESLDFLLAEMSLNRLKLPSGEITNHPLVHAHAKSGKDLIVSTGMATISEIEQALMVVAGGYLANEGIDVKFDWEKAYVNPKARAYLRKRPVYCIA